MLEGQVVDDTLVHSKRGQSLRSVGEFEQVDDEVNAEIFEGTVKNEHITKLITKHRRLETFIGIMPVYANAVSVCICRAFAP